MLLTLIQAAERLGVAAAALRAQVHRDKLKAAKYGRDWLVEAKEVERYRRESQRDEDRP